MLILKTCIIKLSVRFRSERLPVIATVKEDRQDLPQQRVSVMKALHSRLTHFRAALNIAMGITTRGSTPENSQTRIMILGFSKVSRKLMIGLEFRGVDNYMEQDLQDLL
jgi:hypothetical protein